MYVDKIEVEGQIEWQNIWRIENAIKGAQKECESEWDRLPVGGGTRRK